MGKWRQMTTWLACTSISKNPLTICDCNDWFITLFGLELKKEPNLTGYSTHAGIIVKLLVQMKVSITYYIINDIRKFCLRKDKLYVLKMFCSSEKEENFHCIYNSEKTELFYYTYNKRIWLLVIYCTLNTMFRLTRNPVIYNASRCIRSIPTLKNIFWHVLFFKFRSWRSLKILPKYNYQQNLKVVITNCLT